MPIAEPTNVAIAWKFSSQIVTALNILSGEEFYQESIGHVRFSPALLLADQWEAENPNFLIIWPTDKYEGSKLLNVYCQDLV